MPTSNDETLVLSLEGAGLAQEQQPINPVDLNEFFKFKKIFLGWTPFWIGIFHHSATIKTKITENKFINQLQFEMAEVLFAIFVN